MPKTVHVRIAVAVDTGGDWNSAGYGWMNGDHLSDSEASAAAVDGLPAKYADNHVCWVECDVPVPEPTVVKGKVTE